MCVSVKAPSCISEDVQVAVDLGVGVVAGAVDVDLVAGIIVT